MPEKKRTLTRTEEIKIRNLYVSRKVEDAIREQWAKEEFKKPNPVAKFFLTIISYLIAPAMIAALIATIFYPEHWAAQFENMAVWYTWVVIIIFMPLITLLQWIGHSQKPLTHTAIYSLKSNKTTKVIYRILFIVMVILLAMSNHMIVSVIAFFAWLSALLFGAGNRSAIQKAFKKIDDAD